eukprot:924043-Karenia_brevis.AAC.1
MGCWETTGHVVLQSYRPILAQFYQANTAGATVWQWVAVLFATQECPPNIPSIQKLPDHQNLP